MTTPPDHAGIADTAQLERALAMLQRWGVLVHLRDAAGGRVVQVRGRPT